MWKELFFKAVIFDLDGVVIDTAAPIEAFWQKWADAKKIPMDIKMMTEVIHGRPTVQTVARLFGELSKEEKEEILTDGEKMEANLQYVPMAGVMDFLRQMVEKDIKIALVTSSLPAKVEEVFRQIGLYSFFNEVVTADEVENGKPDPACYRLAAKKLGVPGYECLVFEDSLSGTQAAYQANMHVIGINQMVMEPMLKNVGASFVIPDFTGTKLVKLNDGISTFSFGNSYQYSLGEVVF